MKGSREDKRILTISDTKTIQKKGSFVLHKNEWIKSTVGIRQGFRKALIYVVQSGPSNAVRLNTSWNIQLIA